MPKVDYWGIKHEIAHTLDSNIDAFDQVYVEEDVQIAAEQTPWCCVYLVEREIPEGQPIAAGRRVRMRLTFSIWVWVHNLELERAERDRDSLVGEIELVLMANRELNGFADGLMLDGGEMPSKRDPDSPGFFSGGEVRILIDIYAEV